MSDDPSPVAQATPAVAVALGAGVLGAIQPEINAELGDRVGSALLASLVNFIAAFAVVLLVVTLRPGTRGLLRRVASWPVPRWTLIAGLGGSFVVLVGSIAVDTIGVAIFSVAFFAGQITFGVVMDHLGVGPRGVQPLDAARAQAAVIAIAAVVVSQIGRPVGEFAPALVALVVAAGAASALQFGFNGRITQAIGDAYAATALNVAVGLSALIVTVAVLAAAGQLDTPRWPPDPWLYAGGVLGVTIVLALAISTAGLGVLRATLAMLASQLTAAFVVDWVVHHDAPTSGAVVGAVLIVVAVVLVRRPTVAPRPR